MVSTLAVLRDDIGKASLERIRGEGVPKARRPRGRWEALPFEIAEKRPALHRSQRIGTVTDLIWSPRLQRLIGDVWVPIEVAEPGNELEILGPDGSRAVGRTALHRPRRQVALG